MTIERSDEERLERYRFLAEAAKRLAAAAEREDMRTSYERFAKRWALIADDLERQIDGKIMGRPPLDPKETKPGR